MVALLAGKERATLPPAASAGEPLMLQAFVVPVAVTLSVALTSLSLTLFLSPSRWL